MSRLLSIAPRVGVRIEIDADLHVAAATASPLAWGRELKRLVVGLPPQDFEIAPCGGFGLKPVQICMLPLFRRGLKSTDDVSVAPLPVLKRYSGSMLAVSLCCYFLVVLASKH